MSEVGETRNAGERYANDIKAVAGDMVLIIDAGNIQPAVAVAGQDGAAGSGAFPADDPRVGTAVGFAQQVQVGGAFQHLPQAQVNRAVVIRAGGDDNGLPRRVGGEQGGGALGAQGADQPGAPRLALKDAHKDVPHFVDGQAVPGLPGFGGDAGDGALNGPGGVAADKGVDAGGVGVQHRAGAGAGGVVVGAGGVLQAEAAHLPVGAEGRFAGDFGPASHGAAAVVFHGPEAVLGGDEALGEPGVVFVGRPGVGDAPGVAPDLDIAMQAGQGNGAVQGRQGGAPGGGVRKGRGSGGGNGGGSGHNG